MARASTRSSAASGLRLAVVAWALLTSACAAQAPDTILFNGKVFTADGTRPWAQALAIAGERVVAVGDSASIQALAGSSTRQVDLGGRTVVPGFNDAHLHAVSRPPSYRVVVPDDPPTAVVEQALAVANRDAPPGLPLDVEIGGSVLDDVAVDRAWLDARVPARPAFLQAFTGHGMILNSAALELTGVGESVQDPEGGRFGRDASGRLNGRIEEYAEQLVRRRLAGLVPAAAAPDAYRRLSREAVALGITSIQEPGLGDRQAKVVADVITAGVPIRWRAMRFPMREAGGDLQDSKPLMPPQPTRTIDARGMKWILDGSPIERLAALRAPYTDRPSTSGRMNLSPERLAQIVGWAYGTEDPLLVHAVGDAAIAAYLSALEAAGSADTWRAKRPRLEHGDMLTPDLMPRARALGIVVVQNPAHFMLRPAMIARLGEQRVQSLQPMKSLLAAGIPVALGSDGPLSPYLNIMFATLHPVNPAEALSREEAVTAYTRGSAYAEFKDKEKGWLGTGALADLAVLSADLFTVPANQLPALHSVLTMIGGQTVHDAGVLGR
jgi:predicted amidohydrolase YtcJ